MQANALRLYIPRPRHETSLPARKDMHRQLQIPGLGFDRLELRDVAQGLLPPTYFATRALVSVTSASAQVSAVAAGGATSAPRMRCKCDSPQTLALSTSGKTVRP